jgi:Flp pilus assembly protein TadD
MSSQAATRCLALARNAMNVGNDDPVVLAICAHSLIAAGRMHIEGLAAAGRALAANPTNVVVLQLAAICNMLVGDPYKAEFCASRALTLCPGAPEAAECLAIVGFSRFVRRDYVGAIAPLEQARATLRDWPPNHWMLAAAYAQSGLLDDGERLLSRSRELAPNLSLAGIQTVVDRSDGRLSVLREGLIKLGLT